MSDNQSASSEIVWLQRQKPGFGEVTGTDDFLHPNVQLADFTLTETYWFNFYIPERGLTGAAYCWMHKNLGTCTAGVWIYQGFKGHHLQSEHFNVQQHLPYPVQNGQVITIPHIGLEIEILEPLKRHALRYRDPNSSVRFDLMTTALMPPAVRGNGLHFEQAMRIEGKLHLGREVLSIDSMSVRDRSWGQGRSEDPAVHPPLSWCVGVLDGGKTAFNILASDDPAHHPGWAGRYNMPVEKSLRDGWLFHDSRLEHITRISQFTLRDRSALFVPTSYRCDFELESGARHTLEGKVVGRCPFGVWPNLFSTFNFVEWKLDGRRCWGDLQDTYWVEYLRAEAKTP